LKAVGTFCQHYLTASPLPRKLADSRAPVAQLDRASDYGSEGLVFESPRARATFENPVARMLPEKP
jgi:hypothetical protein